MRTHNVYALVPEIEEAKHLIEKGLALNFKPHESMYRGGLYYRFESALGEEFILQKNYDEIEQEWVEEGFEQYPTILFVSGTTQIEYVEEKLSGVALKIVLIRRKTAQ